VTVNEPVTLLGISQGAATCIHYALRHPDSVARLVLYGGYAHGAFIRGGAAGAVAHRAMIDLARVAWGHANPVFRQVFTSRFIPGGTQEQLECDNDLCLKTTTGGIAASLLDARGYTDLTDWLAAVRVPTLVLHERNDEVVPVAQGRHLAGGIPGAEFVELDSRNHVLLEHEPAWNRFREAGSPSCSARPLGRRSRPAGRPSPRSRRASGRCWHSSPTGSATQRSPSDWLSAKRRLGITRRTCSTSSGCGHAPRPSCSRASGGSGPDPKRGLAAASVSGGRVRAVALESAWPARTARTWARVRW